MTAPRFDDRMRRVIAGNGVPLSGVNAVEQPDDCGLRAASLPDPPTRVRLGRWCLVQEWAQTHRLAGMTRFSLRGGPGHGLVLGQCR